MENRTASLSVSQRTGKYNEATFFARDTFESLYADLESSPNAQESHLELTPTSFLAVEHLIHSPSTLKKDHNKIKLSITDFELRTMEKKKITGELFSSSKKKKNSDSCLLFESLTLDSCSTSGEYIEAAVPVNLCDFIFGTGENKGIPEPDFKQLESQKDRAFPIRLFDWIDHNVLDEREDQFLSALWEELDAKEKELKVVQNPSPLLKHLSKGKIDRAFSLF
jgi:hypothetical protein